MMEISSRKVAEDIPKFSIGADLMSYVSCERRYRYYNLNKFPQSDKRSLWNSEFILSVEHEAYRKWKDGCRDPGIQLSNSINEKVCSYLTSKGMETDKTIFMESQDTIPDYLMNRRSYEVLKFLLGQFYPLVSEHDVTLNEYCGGDNPASISDECGIMDTSVLNDCSESNPVAKKILSELPKTDGKSEIIFIFKGMEQPLPGVDDYSNRSHVTQLEASMAIRDRNNRQKNLKTNVVGGVLIYLNELWLSDERIRFISESLGDDGTVNRDVMQQPENVYNGCFRIVPYDSMGANNSLSYLKAISNDLSRKISITNRGNCTAELWPSGRYGKLKCSECDFRYSCSSIPEEEKTKLGM